MSSGHQVSAASPVMDVRNDDAPRPGIALCLSGGGYRATLFHVGALWRLNELAYLPKLKRVSSVSGGSITAAVLGMNWSRLRFEQDEALDFKSMLVTPVRRLASQTIDRGSIISGILRPDRTVAEQVASAYRKHLFGTNTLQALPDTPRFVINATNVQTGSLFRFSKKYLADWRIGVYPNPQIELAVAVAASSAFPPILSPVRITIDPSGFDQGKRGALYHPPFSTDVVLSDGGAYDNLGLETAWKRYDTILVSDGGGQMTPEPKVHSDWLRHGIRVSSVVDNQVRSLRKRQTIAGFLRKDRKGVYWGIRSDITGYDVPGGALPCPFDRTTALAETATRLKAMPDALQEQIINWGYAVCDAGMRAHVDRSITIPAIFPYPNREVG